MFVEQMDTTTNENGLVSPTARGAFTRLFSHRISPWRLQTVHSPGPYTNNGLSKMLVCRQTKGRVQPMVVHCRNEYALCHAAALSGVHDDNLRTSLQ